MLRLLDKYASVNFKKFKIYNKDSFMDSYFFPRKNIYERYNFFQIF